MGALKSASIDRPPHTMGPAGYAPTKFLLLLFLTAAAGAPVGRFSYNQDASTASAAVPLPFPLPEQVVRATNNTQPLALWPRAFRLLDASRTPTRTVALALERYWVRKS